LYKVLYRKWRPKIFDDVVGQEHVTETLKNEVSAEKVAHAYLFSGTRGTGKTSCAKILAKSVNCEKPKNGNPCLGCSACIGIESGTILDVSEIDAASNNGVEHVRAIREEAYFVASTVKYKVYIVDECHMLSAAAFNALLKILEDPPHGVIFILATTEFHKIPKTVVSRCQKFDFHKISVGEVATALRRVSDAEKIEIGQDSLILISKLTNGSVRDAVSILDQCASRSKKIDVNLVRNIVGVTSSEKIERLAEFLILNNLHDSLNCLDELCVNGKSVTRLCEELMDYFRCSFLIKTTGNPPQESLYSLESLQRSSKTMSLDSIISYFDCFKDTYAGLSKSFNSQMELEVAIIKLCNRPPYKVDGNVVSDSKKTNEVKFVTQKGEKNICNKDEIQENISEINFNVRREQKKSYDENEKRKNISETSSVPCKKEKEIYNSDINFSVSQGQKESYDENEKRKNISETGSVPCKKEKEIYNENEVRMKWNNVLSELEGRAPKSLCVLIKGSFAKLKGNSLIIGSKNPFLGDIMKNNSYLKKIEEAVCIIFEKKYKISVSGLENSNADIFDLITEHAKSLDIKFEDF
jgi:DNA polymerase III subunit gamma/tau